MINVENKLDLPVEEIMTTQVHKAKAADRVIDVRHIMTKNHIRHLPVVKGGKMIGILSLTDIQRMSFSGTFGDNELAIDDAISNSFSAEMIMHKNPETIEVGTSVREVAKLLAHREFHALPVVNQGNLVGIITTTDLLKYLIQE